MGKIACLLSILSLILVIGTGCNHGEHVPEKARFHGMVLNQMKYNRSLVNEVLAKIEKTGRAEEIINWSPPTGRASIAFQLMHIAASDDILLSENLRTTAPVSAKYIDDYARGKPAPRSHPSLKEIKKYLAATSAKLAAHVKTMSTADLDKKPTLKAWGTNYEMVQSIIFHEAHHQGQMHISWNMFKAAKGLK